MRDEACLWRLIEIIEIVLSETFFSQFQFFKEYVPSMAWV